MGLPQLKRFANFIYKYPKSVVLLSLFIAALGGIFASQFHIRANFAELLPDHAQSVIDIKQINKRVGGMGTLIVSVTGKSLKDMERFADDLAAKLAAYPKKDVLFVDYKIDTQKAFFDQNKYLYLSVDELKEVRDAIDKKIKKETAKANPFLIDFGGTKKEKEKEKPFDFKAQKEKYEAKLKKFDRYIDGYLTNKTGDQLIIVLKTPGSSTGVDFALRLVDKVEKEIAALSPQSYHDSIEVSLTGALKTLPEEYYALRDDIVVVSNVMVLLVILSVALYYRSIRTTIILGIGLLCGVLTTFGITYLAIGYLTAATAFLAAIVAGNGINFGIYFLARYTEERGDGKDVPDALAAAMQGTIASVATAAFAAGASYASLMATDFKGFNHFGFIGALGMIICLLFALTLDPALCVLFERRFPFEKKGREKGRIFSSAAAYLVTHHTKKVLVVGTLLIAGSLTALSFYLQDPFEYNYRNLRNQVSNKSGSGKKSSAASKILGERSSPYIILAENFEQVPKIKQALEAYTQKNPDPDKRVIKTIKTLYDYLPGTKEEQTEKLALIQDIRKLLTKHSFKSLKPEDRQTLKEMTPPPDLNIITVDDIPAELVRPFIELDGTRGTLVLVYMADGMSVWQGKDLKRFADVVRSLKLEDGTQIRSSGKAVIYSDMIDYVVKEGPYATIGAFILVLLVIVIAYRKFRHIAVLGSAMFVGVLLMMGVAAVIGEKINFLNYIAIPIQFGIGVDYSVNIYHRYLQEGRGSMAKVLKSTGGAVMITSTTTIIGYSAMWFSINGAINSFGTLANIGEVTCLFSATLLMPALLVFLNDRKDRSLSNRNQ